MKRETSFFNEKQGKQGKTRKNQGKNTKKQEKKLGKKQKITRNTETRQDKFSA